MENNELLMQIASLMEEQTKMLRAEMAEQSKTLRAEMAEQVKKLDEKIDRESAKTRLMIENDVTKRIDALLDGYKLNHEKQWELERRMEQLESRVERLETKAG